MPASGLAEFGTGRPPGGRAPLPSCLVLGNFDGVHVGHQAILRSGAAKARSGGMALTAVTFEPHPRTVIDPGLDFRLLSPLELRRRLLVQLEVDQIWVIPFNDHLRQLAPDQFMDTLRARLEIRAMVVGSSFSIGRGAEGRLGFLQGYARTVGFEVEVVEAQIREGVVVSSSEIRARLNSGRLDSVSRMLGRPFQVLGEVVHGEGIGRRLGFPTANLTLTANQALPDDGVYVMELVTSKGLRFGAVGSIGVRPHFGGQNRCFEVHCLGDDPGDLYGQQVLASVFGKIRDQAVFASDRALTSQMSRDAAAAEAYLAGAPAST
ncbi:MAG: riboflavin biosynthesis protein RibF [Candidatus Dormibacteria bacterium]